MNWKEWKSDQMAVIKVDHLESSALALLFENSYRTGNDTNNNVMVATVSPEGWLDELVPTILDYVSYVCKFPTFQISSYRNKEILVTHLFAEKLLLNSIDEVKDFLKEKGSFSTLVIYAIIKYVDLSTLKESWAVRFCHITDLQGVRNKKLNYLTDGIDNN